MNKIAQKYYRFIPAILLSFLMLIFIGCGLGLAYVGGVFTGKNEVIANDKRITDQTVAPESPTIPKHVEP